MWPTPFLPKPIAASTLLVCLLCTVSLAKNQESFPAEIVTAKTVNVMAQLGTSGSSRIRPNAQRAKAQVEAALRKWGRYQIVDSPAKADLVLIVVEGNATAGSEEPVRFRMTAMQLLSDTLTIYKGGGIKPDSKPLWSCRETGEDLGWPADRAVERLRRDERKATLDSAMQNNR